MPLLSVPKRSLPRGSSSSLRGQSPDWPVIHMTVQLKTLVPCLPPVWQRKASREVNVPTQSTEHPLSVPARMGCRACPLGTPPPSWDSSPRGGQISVAGCSLSGSQTLCLALRVPLHRVPTTSDRDTCCRGWEMEAGPRGSPAGCSGPSRSSEFVSSPWGPPLLARRPPPLPARGPWANPSISLDLSIPRKEPDSNAHLLAYQGLPPNAQNRACCLSGPHEHLGKDEGL